ncbi:HD-GYP domain-containing protein [Oceanobacillus alkalisoli]|uniref:HD-GYP domain-containing protein n=1 Tax=Oceanobacillus alkalisoli TaxID=2925113 RepID=UPI001EEFCE72|nr:HD-GYP domain-containing protein [Oceanobacillus alkalisoli]MCF3944018.1 HD-GYP domain-containing protein [Oceanobacillus alkalisoli]MCG5103290.1 HD-GYP domain-containing protein [Oceanobacillus alkalisoli]
MRVHPSQLVAGTVLLLDVLGKSGHPIINERTVLTNEHITVLHKFLIESVEVSTKLENGETFIAKEQPKRVEKPKPVQKKIYLEPEEDRSFPAHYMEAVRDYKQLFTEWNNNVPIDMVKVRQSILPLLERIEELDMEIFTLHQYGTREDYIYYHGVAVSLLSAFLGKELGYRKGEWIQIGLAAYLADAGMTRIDFGIITKGSPLTEPEENDMRNHSTYSYRMVEKVTGLSKAGKIAILQHHERMDGSGYPLGIRNEQINTFARILAVCDTYYAMTSDRLEKQSVFKALEELFQERYTKLDPQIVQSFIESLARRAVGKTVHLSNHKTGEIVYFDDDHPASPLVKLHETGEIIGLQMNPNLHIEEIILD